MSKKNQNTAVVLEETTTILETPTTTVSETPAKVETTIQGDLAALMTEHKTKSGVIRHLSSLGHKNGPIAKFMNIRFQHVRNVLVTPIKKA